MSYDLVIRNALVLDGTNGDPWIGDIAVTEDRIAALGAIAASGRVEIDADGLIASPGFIDVHTHDDRLVLSSPAMLPKLSQGVTTVVTGNCGISLAPFSANDISPPLTLLGLQRSQFFADMAAYRKAFDAGACAVNVVPLTGHTSLRVCAMSDLTRPATRRERADMLAALDEALENGSFGLSTGLYYPPAYGADAEELRPLLERTAAVGGLCTSHLRDEGDGLLAALDEALTLAGEAGTRLVVSHLKCAAPSMWGRSAEALSMIERAAARQPVAFDVYPYEASSTMIRPDRLAGARRIQVSWSEPHPEAAGRDLSDIASCWCCSLEDAAQRLTPGGAIYYKMQEADVRRIVAHPLAMIGSDGLPHDRHPHPRLWGTFPRVLGRYVRELGLLELPDAIRKMTSLPARVFGLHDRGVLRAGARADITIFDPVHVLDVATYDEPVQPAHGIAHVIVNGRLAWRHGAPTGELAGFLLRRDADANISPAVRDSLPASR